jgi:CheY-specific phosphatase CheX
MPNEITEKLRSALSDAVILTFQKMTMVECAPIPSIPLDARLSGFSGIVGFSGLITGNCVLRLSSYTAKEAMTRLSGESVDDVAEISDGVGELVNMIAGNAKAALPKLELMLSMPQVIRGEGHEIGFHRFTELIELYFSSEIGDFEAMTAYSTAPPHFGDEPKER